MEHVLLVEDDAILRKLVGNFLKAESYIVEEAGSVEEAKYIIDTELIDIIVADFQLGMGTARDLYEWLVLKYPKMKDQFIVVSGWLDIEGFPYFLGKPFRVDDLIGVIRQAMQGSIGEIPPPSSRVRKKA